MIIMHSLNLLDKSLKAELNKNFVTNLKAAFMVVQTELVPTECTSSRSWFNFEEIFLSRGF